MDWNAGLEYWTVTAHAHKCMTVLNLLASSPGHSMLHAEKLGVAWGRD